jgi:hypothetical protein
MKKMELGLETGKALGLRDWVQTGSVQLNRTGSVSIYMGAGFF